MAANPGKRNFVINSVGDTTTISILGDIGESWFDEGYTMHNAKRDLENAKTPKINLIVSSLGGLVKDALVIHDLIKMKDAEVTSQILGLTASSGTIVAQSADKGKATMSVNSKHLIHNVMDIAFGNASELRKHADNLEKMDDTLVGIYTDRIGDKKTETEIRDLMGKEEWVDAGTAKDWGFVDETFTPGSESTAIDCYDCGPVNAHKGFPNIDESKPAANPANPDTPTNTSIMDKFNMTKFNQNVKDLLAKLNPNNAAAPDPPAPAQPDQEIMNMVKELETGMQNLATSNQVLTNEKIDLQAKYDKLYAAYKPLALATATKTGIEEIDAEITENEKAGDTNQQAHDANAESLREKD